MLASPSSENEGRCIGHGDHIHDNEYGCDTLFVSDGCSKTSNEYEHACIIARSDCVAFSQSRLANPSFGTVKRLAVHACG